MSRWTNDHWPATRHRVVASAVPGHQRTTLTTFHMPALTTTIAPLAKFVGADGPHYEPLTAYDSEKASIRNYALPREDALQLDPSVVEFASETR
jgi:isopenicillin N synthase-like dioxygenase